MTDVQLTRYNIVLYPPLSVEDITLYFPSTKQVVLCSAKDSEHMTNRKLKLYFLPPCPQQGIGDSHDILINRDRLFPFIQFRIPSHWIQTENLPTYLHRNSTPISSNFELRKPYRYCTYLLNRPHKQEDCQDLVGNFLIRRQLSQERIENLVH